MPHAALAPVLDKVRAEGIGILPDLAEDLASYRHHLAAADPDALSPDEALAYWLNLYNAGTLELVAGARRAGVATVLRVPGAYDKPIVTVAGEALSLDNIEHGKVRRLGDPRIHAALVCGTASCPTLRFEPFTGDRVRDQLEDQMRRWLDAGAAFREGDRLMLSRVLLWYGSDFVRPQRMPTIRPAGRAAVRAAVSRWLPAELKEWTETVKPQLGFLPYDYTLACSIG